MNKTLVIGDRFEQLGKMYEVFPCVNSVNLCTKCAFKDDFQGCAKAPNCVSDDDEYLIFEEVL